jgi:hypothetical protein
MEKVWTWPRRKLAKGVPVLAVPGRSEPSVLKEKDPVGDGGWTAFNRSHRQSKPVFSVCRPFTQVNVSAISVTLVSKSDAVLAGDPSC